MRGGNENKNGIVHRLINSMVKPPEDEKKFRPKSPVQKFNYQLPKSFFDAVDNARIEAGYDVLPHFHQLSISPSSNRRTLSSSPMHQPKRPDHHNRSEKRHKHAHSSSASDNDNISSKKVQVHRANHKHSHHHHHLKKVAESSSANSSSRSSDNIKTPSSKRFGGS